MSASWEPASWDTAELQGVPYILGITHPTGFPLYVMLGYLWSHAIAISTVAWRMNAMSGVAIAVACVAAYGTARQFGANRAIALLATMWFAFSRNVWAHAARAEAQDLAVMCAALSIYLFVRWMREGDDRRFLAAFALCGVAMTAHPNALWILPGLVRRSGDRAAPAFAASDRRSPRALRCRARALPISTVALGIRRRKPPRSRRGACRAQAAESSGITTIPARLAASCVKSPEVKHRVGSTYSRHSIRCTSATRCGPSSLRFTNNTA